MFPNYSNRFPCLNTVTIVRRTHIVPLRSLHPCILLFVGHSPPRNYIPDLLHHSRTTKYKNRYRNSKPLFYRPPWTTTLSSISSKRQKYSASLLFYTFFSLRFKTGSSKPAQLAAPRLASQDTPTFSGSKYVKQQTSSGFFFLDNTDRQMLSPLSSESRHLCLGGFIPKGIATRGPHPAMAMLFFLSGKPQYSLERRNIPSFAPAHGN